jgi:RNA polymerase sigma-70 factor (ECF subfamily)
VVQETLLALLRHLGSFRGDASFTTWVFTVARTHYGRALRTQQRHRRRADRLAQHLLPLQRSLVEHNHALAASELREGMSKAMDSLSALDRAVLMSRDYLGCSAAETAAALSLSVPAVKTRLYRARSRLRSLLDSSLTTSAA